MNYDSSLFLFFELIALFSLITFVASLILVPACIKRLPYDFFITYNKNTNRLNQPVHIFSSFLRNIIGLLLLLAGFIMLFIPGQGLLTILLGCILISFPGKWKLVEKLISYQPLRKSLNWSREKLKAPLFLWPDDLK